MGVIAMTAQIYQIRDYQPNEAPLRLARKQLDETAQEIARLMKGMGFCVPVIDTQPAEMNPDDCA